MKLLHQSTDHTFTESDSIKTKPVHYKLASQTKAFCRLYCFLTLRSYSNHKEDLQELLAQPNQGIKRERRERGEYVRKTAIAVSSWVGFFAAVVSVVSLLVL